MIFLFLLCWVFGIEAGCCCSKTQTRVQPQRPHVPPLVLPKQQPDPNSSTPGSRPIVLTITSQLVVSRKLVKHHGRGPSVGGIDPIRNCPGITHVAD